MSDSDEPSSPVVKKEFPETPSSASSESTDDEPTSPCADNSYAASDVSTEYEVGLKEDLLTALTSIQVAGSFAVSASLYTPPPAGIFVPDIGHIRMPLEEGQAKLLIAKGRLAPCYLAAPIYPGIQYAWELDATQFSFQDPGWTPFLNDLCAKVASELGVGERGVRAEVDKMLLTEKGAIPTSKSEADSVKSADVFGTLVVTLPSPHDGGEIVLRHGGQMKTYNSAEATQSIGCWYSDVAYEALPVKSGYRWVLTFNLVLARPLDQIQQGVILNQPSAALQRRETRNLRHTLRKWLSTDTSRHPQSHLYHILDNNYTENNWNISPGSLTGRDLAQFQALKALTEELPFDIFLALLEKKRVEVDDFSEHDMEERDEDEEEEEEEEYSDDDDDKKPGQCHGDLIEETHSVKTLTDLDQRTIIENMDLNLSALLDEERFEDLETDQDADDDESPGHASFWNHVSAILIVPRDTLASFFEFKETPYNSYGHGMGLSHMVRYWAAASRRSPSNSIYIDTLEKLCEQAWTARSEKKYRYDVSGIPSSPPFSAKCMEDMSMTALQLGRQALFEKSASHHQGALPLTFFDWVHSWLRADLDEQGAKNKFELARSGLFDAICQYNTLGSQFDALVKIIPSLNRSTPRVFSASPAFLADWALDTLFSCIDARLSKPLFHHDGIDLVNITGYFRDPADTLSNIIAKIGHRRDSPGFCLAFLRRLYLVTLDGLVAFEHGFALYRCLADLFISSTSFSTLRKAPEPPPRATKYSRRHRIDATQPPADPTVDKRMFIEPASLTEFVMTLVDVPADGTDNLLEMFIMELTGQVTKLPLSEFNELWIPFLQSLTPLLSSKGIPLDTPFCQRLYSAFFGAYMNNYVGPKPIPAKNLVKPQVACYCPCWAPLNVFLCSAHESESRFYLTKHQQTHSLELFIAGGIECATVAEEPHKSGPQSFLVLKTSLEEDAAKQKWKARREKASHLFGTFQHHDLVLLLGQEQFNWVVGMLRLPAPVRASLPQQQQQHQVPPVEPFRREHHSE